ncbi:hypothetical protein [Caballeronia concitans]|uniref:Uncharacterized protein n=1 Tax=Caballeronia concitans TaxID=1777133 RepID=A0A658R1L9_9BURK|nr:hypothetical protein [Caballeronia concitans]KIG08601.1 hypothetical protein BurMR1_0265 [Burkholderia sp. MR1]SAL40285.1 hypothetical protein AWB72_04215 [Caballeronia concitans]
MKHDAKAAGTRDAIVRTVRSTITALEVENLDCVECNAVATRARAALESGHESLCARYGFTQFLLDVTRRELARRYGAQSEDTRAIQGELFTGVLQRRYPIPHEQRENPQYVLLEVLTTPQVHWNAAQHRKVGRAHLKHADALEEYANRRGKGVSAA